MIRKLLPSREPARQRRAAVHGAVHGAVLLVVLLVLLAPATRAAEGDAVDSLRRAEEAFAASVVARDLEAFTGWIADDAVFAGGGEPLVGRQAVVAAWSVFFADGGPRITWSPESVVVSPGGEVGMTRGPYRFEVTGPDGAPAVTAGTFFSVWRRTEAGWRVILDNGTPGVPLPAPFEGPFAGLEWLAGTWRGPGLGGECEETWNAPAGGAMLGMFRLIRDGRPAVYEIITLTPDDDGGLTLRLKHFGGDLVGWEEMDEAVLFPFVSRSEGELILDGLAYRGDGQSLRVEVQVEEGTQPAVLELRRAP